MILTGMLQFGVRQSTEFINQMTSVERVLDYTEIKPEEDAASDNLNMTTIAPKTDTSDSENWPQFGRISFNHTYLRYSPDDDPVLNDLNFEIKPGEKVKLSA